MPTSLPLRPLPEVLHFGQMAFLSLWQAPAHPGRLAIRLDSAPAERIVTPRLSADNRRRRRDAAATGTAARRASVTVLTDGDPPAVKGSMKVADVRLSVEAQR